MEWWKEYLKYGPEYLSEEKGRSKVNGRYSMVTKSRKSTE